MPFSSNYGKAWIREQALALPEPQRVLDVGPGAGTYPKLFPEWAGAEWTGVEVWEPYVEKFGLHDLYDELVIQDARTWVPPGQYDVAFLGDVLEHMEIQEARDLLDKVRSCAAVTFVAIPLGHYPQGPYEGNPYETHIKDNWTHDDVLALLGTPAAHAVDGNKGVYRYEPPERLKIAVYAISKNEANFVPRFLESCADADLVVIGDTGSTDGTDTLAAEMGAVVHRIHVSPWRFDLARNAVLALLPNDIDVCVSLDLDEVLTGGWRQKIQQVWRRGVTTRLEYGFDWGHGIVFRYQKIHGRHGYLWHHPVHEYPVPDGRINEVYAHVREVLVVHMPDDTKSRGQYMGLLELAIREDPRCPRNRFYHARELTFCGRWHEAIDALKAYLDMPEADWPNERCYAMRLLGKSYDALGDDQEALRWWRRACAEAPGTREPWVELAEKCYRLHMWPECYGAVKSALAITTKLGVYTMDPTVWGAKPYDYGAIAAYHLGNKDEATRLGRLALEADPADSRLRENLGFYEAPA